MTKNERAKSIVDYVARYYSIPTKDVLSQKRDLEIVNAKFGLYYILDSLGYTPKEIGIAMNKSRSNIIYSRKTISNLMETDYGFKLHTIRLLTEIKQNDGELPEGTGRIEAVPSKKRMGVGI